MASRYFEVRVMHECRNARMHGRSAPRLRAFLHLCIRAFSFVSLAGLSVAVLAQTADRARTEALASRAAERIQALQREADQLASQERTLLGDLRKLEIDRQIKSEEFHQADTQLKQVQA